MRELGLARVAVSQMLPHHPWQHHDHEWFWRYEGLVALPHEKDFMIML
jgi:hypothetical protein